MRLRRSWNVAVVLLAVSLVVTLQLVDATHTSATVSEIAGAAVPNTTALDPDGVAGGWSALVALVFLAVANVVALGRRHPRRRPETQPSSTPWERLVAARY